MDWSTAIPLMVTVGVAILGFVAKYLNDVRLAQRAARLDRLDRQLGEFYGPLLALSYAGGVAWAAASQDIRPHGPSFKEQAALSADEAAKFRLWMGAVLMPLNRRLVELILQKSDLLEQSEMPDVLLEVCGNVLPFEANVQDWKAGNFTRTWSFKTFPGEALRDYASACFSDLKRQQTELLKKLG